MSRKNSHKSAPAGVERYNSIFSLIIHWILLQKEIERNTAATMKKRKSGTPEPIESILERVFTSLDLGMKVKQYQIWEVWDSVVGEAIARQARPQQIRNMILWISVSSSTWMQQLEFMKKQIVNRLNEHIGEVVIKDIRFRIGEIKESD